MDKSDKARKDFLSITTPNENQEEVVSGYELYRKRNNMRCINDL
jgi:hypothetical protein